MPIVPSATGPAVGLAPLPTPRAPVEAFGGGEASRPIDLAPIANVATDLYREAKQKADQIAVVDAGSKVSALETDLLYNPTTGVLAQKGKNAFGAVDTATAAYQKSISDIEGTLANDDQKAAFRRLAASHGAALNEQMQRHVSNENEAYDKESTAAYLTNEQNAGINGTPERTEMAVANQRAAILDFGKRQGWSEDQTQQHIAQTVSKTRFGVLERLVNAEQDIAATKYLTDHHDDFVGSDLLQAEKLTDAGSTRAESQRQADGITTKATSLTDALSTVRNITDPRVRDATEQRVRRFYEDQAADLRQQRAVSFDKVSQLLEQNGGDIHTLPLGDLANLTPEQHTAIETRAEHIRHPKVETNVSMYTHLINLSGLSDATRSEFLKINFSDPQYASQLSDTDFRHVVNLQATMRRGEDKAADASARRDATDAKRTDARAAAGVTSLHRKEETGILHATDAAAKAEQQRADAADKAKAMGLTIPQAAAAPTQKVAVPKWMIDSAATDGEYHDYLSSHHVKGLPPRPVSGDQPTVTPAPGGPIQRPPPQASAAAPVTKKKSVTIERDLAGRAIRLTPHD